MIPRFTKLITLLFNLLFIQGVPKVVVQTFGLNAQPSAEFLTPNLVNILPEALIRRFNHQKFENPLF